MQAALQRRVQRYGWDKASGWYERYWSAQLEPAQTRMLDAARLRPGDEALDVACGSGLVSFRAAAAVAPAGRVLGVDISEKMVEAARHRALETGCANARFLRMDGERLELPDASFDAALCALGLMYLPDPVAGLREMRRVLRQGGRAAAAVWGRRGRCGWAGIFPVIDRRVESEVCPMFFQLGTGANLELAFRQAGFSEIAVERIETLLRYDSAEDACGAAFAGGPVAMAWSRFDERTRDEASREYLLTIEPYRSGAGYLVPGEFVVASGIT